MFAEDSAAIPTPPVQVLIIYRTLPGCARTVSALHALPAGLTSVAQQDLAQQLLDTERKAIGDQFVEFHNARWETQVETLRKQ